METYPKYLIRDRRVYSDIHRYLGESGTLNKNTNETGRLYAVRIQNTINRKSCFN